MKKRTLLFRVACYIAFVLSILLIIYKTGITVSDLSPETILKLAHHNTLLVLCIMLVLMCLQNLFTFIPLILVITINIALFGFWKGYLFSTFSSVIGSTAIFLSIRYLFPNLFSSTILQQYEQKIEKNGFLFVLSGRILPFMPTNLINIVSGLSSIKLSHFMFATTLGNMIYGFALASASFSLITLSNHNNLLFLLIIGIILIIFLVRFIKKRKEPKTS